MNCLASIVKYIMWLFNLIFLVVGILLIVLGSIILADMGDFKSFSEAINTETIPILIIVLGCLIFLISFLGCCGAIKENACLMTSYGVCMFILFCLQVALVVWIFVKRNEFINTMSDIVEEAWNGNNEANGYPMDALQLAFKCCGVYGYQDYKPTTVPKSCCGSMDNVCLADVYKNRPGCKIEFVDFWTSNMDIIRWSGIGIAIVELIAFAFAFCLVGSMRRS